MNFNICENFYPPDPTFMIHPPNRSYVRDDLEKISLTLGAPGSAAPTPAPSPQPNPLLQKIKDAFNSPTGLGVMVTCNPLDYPTGPIYMDGSATILRGNSTWDLFNPSGKKVQLGFFWDPSNNQAVVNCGFLNDAASSYRVDCAVPPSGFNCSKKGKSDRCGYCSAAGGNAFCGEMLPTLCKPPSSPAPWPKPVVDNNCVQDILNAIPQNRAGINEFVFLPEYEANSPPPTSPGMPQSPLEIDKVFQMMENDNIPFPAGLVFIYDIMLKTGPTKILQYADTQAIIQKYITAFGNPPPKVLVIEMDTQAYKENRESRFPPKFTALLLLTQLIPYLQSLTNNINEPYKRICHR